MGALIGLFIALIFYFIHRWLPASSNIEIVLTLVTPYCMYYFAEHFHFSGVLAVVCGGLFLSNKRQQLLSYESRIQGVNVWSNLVFVLNGLVFLLIGLQLPTIANQLGEVSLRNAIWYGLVISLVLIITRLACTLGAALFTKLMSNFIKVRDPNPGWKIPIIFGWAGMRGVVSLAAALSIPLYISAGNPFPYRNLILFITFIVILVTLVFQGLTLPWLIRRLNPEDKFSTISQNEQEQIIQKKLSQTSLELLDEKYNLERNENEHLENLYTRLQTSLNFFRQGTEDVIHAEDNPLSRYQEIYLEILEKQRELLAKINQRADFDEDLIRKYMALIDLEEFRLREKQITRPDS
jgi:CPA1 family monovalent cation:H+ antiporter